MGCLAACQETAAQLARSFDRSSKTLAKVLTTSTANELPKVVTTSATNEYQERLQGCWFIHTCYLAAVLRPFSQQECAQVRQQSGVIPGVICFGWLVFQAVQDLLFGNPQQIPAAVAARALDLDNPDSA